MMEWRDRLGRVLNKMMGRRKLLLLVYLAISFAVILLLGPLMGREIFPKVSAGQFQLRFRAPIGTRVGATEIMALRLLDEIHKVAGAENVAVTLGYVGTQPPAYPINTIFLWTSGPQDAVLRVALKPDSSISVGSLEERLRDRLPSMFPGSEFSFEAGDIVSQTMNFGAPTPIEVAVNGPNLPEDRTYAEKLRAELAKIPVLRDLQFEQPLDYPAVEVNVNRERAGQLGVSIEQVGRSLVAATSSSRFVTPNYWADPKSGIAYQVQVEIPIQRMNSPEELRNVPVSGKSGATALLRDVATVTPGTAAGEYDRYNMQRMVTLTANLANS